MNKLATSKASSNRIDWFEKNQQDVEAHEAWHFRISEKDAENLLEGKEPFNYLLRSGKDQHSYFISFVKEDKSIKHQFFVLEFELNGWIYRNGATTGPAQVVSPILEDLIPMMMHCEEDQCQPIEGSYQARR